MASRARQKVCIFKMKAVLEAGFTVFEIFLALLLVATLVVIGLPSYYSHVKKNQNNAAVVDIKQIELSIEGYYYDNGYTYPPDLSSMGLQTKLDPWGNPYQYLNIANLPDKGKSPKARKDKNLHPINSDFDLYSKGEDGQSNVPLTAKASRDDIIRANNGSFIGLGEDY